MTTRPHFIYVSPVLPLPADQGSKRFQLELGRTLLQLGSVDWVTREIGDQSQARAELQAEGFRLHLDRSFVPQDAWHRLRRRVGIDARALRWGRPRELAFTCTPRVVSLVRDAVAARPDAIGIGAFWHSWRALQALPRERRVLVLSDVEHARLAAAAELGLARADRVARLRAAELEAIAQLGLVLALSDEDRAVVTRLASAAGTRVGLWPVAVPACAPIEPAPASAALRLFCYGRWEAAFNRDGLEDFVARVWPALRSARPELRLAVAGSGLGAALARELGAAGIEVVGWVQSLPEELGRSHAVLVPLRYAGGVRYRLLEAFAYGMPCIASPVAARGCGARPGVHYLQAEAPAEWLSALDELGNAGRARALGDAARSFVLERCGGASVVQRAGVALESVFSPSLGGL